MTPNSWGELLQATLEGALVKKQAKGRNEAPVRFVGLSNVVKRKRAPTDRLPFNGEIILDSVLSPWKV